VLKNVYFKPKNLFNKAFSIDLRVQNTQLCNFLIAIEDKRYIGNKKRLSVKKASLKFQKMYYSAVSHQTGYDHTSSLNAFG